MFIFYNNNMYVVTNPELREEIVSKLTARYVDLWWHEKLWPYTSWAMSVGFPPKKLERISWWDNLYYKSVKLIEELLDRKLTEDEIKIVPWRVQS